MTRTYAKDRALAYVKAYRAAWAKMREDYADDCREYARQGYRPHHCIHGTDQWTDYDNICGACEEYGWNGFPNVYDLAIGRAKADRENGQRDLASLQRLKGYLTDEEWSRLVDAIASKFYGEITL